MNEASVKSVRAYIRFVQVVVGAIGVSYSLIGIALIFFPLWFFQSIGNFPPYNRHYEGDLGAFILAAGIGLLLAISRPEKYTWVIRIVALASLFHAANHIYDAIAFPSINAWGQVIALLVVGLALAAASMPIDMRIS